MTFGSAANLEMRQGRDVQEIELSPSKTRSVCISEGPAAEDLHFSTTSPDGKAVFEILDLNPMKATGSLIQECVSAQGNGNVNAAGGVRW